METILSTDHTAIAYKKTGTGTPLIMVHGTNGSHAHWNLALPQLNQHFTVYAMERRGRGQSGDASDYSIEREFEDVAALANSIGRSGGYIRTFLRGGMCFGSGTTNSKPAPYDPLRATHAARTTITTASRNAGLAWNRCWQTVNAKRLSSPYCVTC